MVPTFQPNLVQILKKVATKNAYFWKLFTKYSCACWWSSCSKIREVELKNVLALDNSVKKDEKKKTGRFST